MNASAPVLLESATAAMFEDAAATLVDGLDGLIVEVTEETLVHSDTHLLEALAPLRALGARLAVDEVGAGYSGLRQITAVRPSYLKLDRSLLTGIDADPERAALVAALVGYCRQVGSALVAEGIETEQELRAVEAIGAPLVQGYCFSRPAPPWPRLERAGVGVERLDPEASSAVSASVSVSDARAGSALRVGAGERALV